ncbi:hypothetical protein M378DRAFT_180051 [Amanita muscaria Koide BX008]|uniref:C2H2-type domain-containing protein n=1 Tax=Amanita muscaria (strain Koide BX008) TaxID=946122 RepID=A0A0C2WXI6_AMAMK|nr:hypothetical protein M378DRAFT_180051 [Amanita muscaria Koide BX008]
MLRVSSVPLLCRSTSSTSNVGLSYPSSRTNVVRRDGLDGMIDNGAHQYTTASDLAESAQIQIEPHQHRVLQRLEELTAVRANIDAQLRYWQDLYHKQQYALAQQRDHIPFTTTTTPYVPFMPTSPYPTTDISPHSFSQTADLPPSQVETWNIPHHMPPPSTSQLSPAPCTQPATHPPPKRTVRNRPGKKVFRCECGHEASRKGDMKRHRESIGHAEKSHICHCGKSYTRKDSLLRHATTGTHA